MNLGVSTEQQELGKTIRRLFERKAPAPVLRELWQTETGRSPQVWNGLVDVGVPALLIPVEYDGLGATEVDMYAVLNEAGRAAVPDALLESCVLAPVLLAGSDACELKKRWLPALASGEARATVAMNGLGAVPDAHVSDVILVVEGEEATAYERDEVELRPLASMDPSRRVYEVTPRRHSGTPIDGAPVRRIRSLNLAGSAVLLNGLGARLIEFATEYAKVREQFGRAVGSFQSVKHQLASAHSKNELSRQAGLAAMHDLSRDGSLSTLTSALAHVCAVEAERDSNRVSLQVHGGIGFTWEHDLQIWLKLGKTLELAHGTWRESSYAAGALSVGARPR